MQLKLSVNMILPQQNIEVKSYVSIMHCFFLKVCFYIDKNSIEDREKVVFQKVCLE